LNFACTGSHAALGPGILNAVVGIALLAIESQLSLALHLKGAQAWSAATAALLLVILVASQRRIGRARVGSLGPPR
jgi:hypothetical protein